jgi:hypothetical protein
MERRIDAGEARNRLVAGVGRRGFLLAAGAVGGAGMAATGAGAAGASAAEVSAYPREILQPGKGPVHGTHYLPSLPEQVRWGYVPALDSEPVLRMRSGETVTVDSVSHEGILEDQGRDPVAYFREHGVPRGQVRWSRCRCCRACRTG